MTLDRTNRIGIFGMTSVLALAKIAAECGGPGKGVQPCAVQAVYLALACIASQQGTASVRGQECRTTIPELTGRTRLSDRHVQRCLDELERVGLIARQVLTRAGHNTATHVTFLYEWAATSTTPESAGAVSTAPPPPAAASVAPPAPRPQDSRVRTTLEKETKRDSAQARDGGTENAPLPLGRSPAFEAIRAQLIEKRIITGRSTYQPPSWQRPQWQQRRAT